MPNDIRVKSLRYVGGIVNCSVHFDSCIHLAFLSVRSSEPQQDRDRKSSVTFLVNIEIRFCKNYKEDSTQFGPHGV